MSNMDTYPCWTCGGVVFRGVFVFWDNCFGIMNNRLIQSVCNGSAHFGAILYNFAVVISRILYFFADYNRKI